MAALSGGQRRSSEGRHEGETVVGVMDLRWSNEAGDDGGVVRRWRC
jgi:hypothetical protein